MNILITGANGYIGSGLVKDLSKNHNITILHREILDLTNLSELKSWINNKYFDIVIHTAIKGGSRLSKDNSSVLDNNIKMYLNLLECDKHFDKFINIGSGAELSDGESYYGLSKKIITQSIIDKEDYYTLRIYGIFNEKELPTRFIRRGLENYLQHQNLIVHGDRLMDFIYWKDFVSIIEYYIDAYNPPKIMDCVYEHKYSLFEIAKYIIQLDSYSVDIELQNQYLKDYIGTYTDLGIEYIGLQQGIRLTYQELNNEKNMVCSQ